MTPPTSNYGVTSISSDPNLQSGTSASSYTNNVSTRGQQHSASPSISSKLPSQSSYNVNEIVDFDSEDATPPPLNTTPPAQRANAIANPVLSVQTAAAPISTPRSLSMALGNLRAQGEDSPVMNETLSVIDEHIIDLNTPGSSLRASGRRGTNDSGSEYSTQIDHRLSYIAGHETDEEERNLHNRIEVMTWTPSQVAECLKDVGVESRHCDVFKEQEISGEVLLAMDQASVFMKEFDLGLVGQRLRTWHKIKALQDDVKSHDSISNKTLNLPPSDGCSDDVEPYQGRNSISGSTLPHITKGVDPTGSRSVHSRQSSRQESQNAQRSQSPQLLRNHRETTSRPPSFTFLSQSGSPGRPSAASIRDLNHSRRHSAVDISSSFAPELLNEVQRPSTPSRTVTSPHKKTPSLDHSWTLSNAVSMNRTRPLSAISTGVTVGTDRNTFDPTSQDSAYPTNALRDVDRGYASGGDVESKKPRNVLRKRDVVSASHSRQSSNLEDHRRASIAGSKRHSRFGSVDSIRDTVAAMTSPASKMYNSNSLKGRFRNSSANETILATAAPPNELTSPAVTKLEYNDKPRMSVVTSSPKLDGEISSNVSRRSSATSPRSGSKPRMGLRAISDAVTGGERTLITSPASVPSPAKENAVYSPTRTESTTTSGASVSIELESTDASSKGTNGTHTGLTPTSGTRRKTKKETSAYTRGLELKSPQEQMVGCDYNGWMKKKSSNLMTTWKPRLFVLRGRRLSYYYSETDTQEKGLIDISSHRVLPADSDLITGIHATVTGAKSTPVSPSNAHTTTIASAEAAAQPESTLPRSTQKGNADAMFIFKLVPPRAGLSRAVNFTKPTVHYFAVENITQGRLWMAALMKATIDRDETKPITTTYQQKTISLAKARMMRHRPPALMGLDEKAEALQGGPKSDETGLLIQGLEYEKAGKALEHKVNGSLSVSLSAMPRSASTPVGAADDRAESLG